MSQPFYLSTQSYIQSFAYNVNLVLFEKYLPQIHNILGYWTRERKVVVSSVNLKLKVWVKVGDDGVVGGCEGGGSRGSIL